MLWAGPVRTMARAALLPSDESSRNGLASSVRMSGVRSVPLSQRMFHSSPSSLVSSVPLSSSPSRSSTVSSPSSPASPCPFLSSPLLFLALRCLALPFCFSRISFHAAEVAKDLDRCTVSHANTIASMSSCGYPLKHGKPARTLPPCMQLHAQRDIVIPTHSFRNTDKCYQKTETDTVGGC